MCVREGCVSVCVYRTKDERSERESLRAHSHCIGVLLMDVDDVMNPRILQVFPIASYIVASPQCPLSHPSLFPL